MITKEEEKVFKKTKLYRFWNFLIYGSSIAIGVFLNKKTPIAMELP